MKIKGLLVILLLAMVVVYFLFFAKAGKKSPLETMVDARQKMSLDLTQANMQTLIRAIEFFSGMEGRVPEDLSELSRARIVAPTATDGWGRPFRYEKLSASSFRLTSAGQDGRFGSRDDIVIMR